MGNDHSVRETHFNRPEDEADALDDETLDQHHINISNKMVNFIYICLYYWVFYQMSFEYANFALIRL